MHEGADAWEVFFSIPLINNIFIPWWQMHSYKYEYIDPICVNQKAIPETEHSLGPPQA